MIIVILALVFGLTIGKYQEPALTYKVYMPVAVKTGIRPVCRFSLWVFVPRDQCDYV